MTRRPRLPSGIWKRGNVYYSCFRAGGRLIRKRLSSDLRTATQMLNELRARADRAGAGMLDNELPVAQLKEEFLRWAKQQVPRTFPDYKADLERYLTWSGVHNVAAITPNNVIAYREHRLDSGVCPRTVNRELAALRAMLNKGVRWKRISYNPIRELKDLRHDNPRKVRRPLTIEDAEQLLLTSPEYIQPVWLCFLTTGMRSSEVVELRFADIDFEQRIITVRPSQAKSHKAREIPIKDELFAQLVRLREEARHREPVDGYTPELTQRQHVRFTREHVFVTKANTPWNNNLLTRFYACCKRAGIEIKGDRGDVDIHSLRVTFTTLTLENGGRPKAVQAILGHSTLELTMSVYARATDRAKREALDSLPIGGKTGTPDHVIPVQSAHSLRTKRRRSSQVDLKSKVG